MKVYLIYFDHEDSGERENWSVFYCEPEVYTDPVLANARIEELEKITDGRVVHVVETEINKKFFT